MPTSLPTYYSEAYAATSMFSTYRNFTQPYIGRPNLKFFSTFSFKGVVKDGNCLLWSQFQQSLLQLAADNVLINNFQIGTVKFDTDSGGILSNRSQHCVDSTLCKTFLTNFAYKVTSNMQCRGSWSLNPCSHGTGAGYMLLSVNANPGCDEYTCPAADGGLLVNPCIACHARVTYYSYVLVDYSYQILFPTFLSIVVTPRRSAVVVNVSISKGGTVYCAAFLSSSASASLTKPLSVKNAGVSVALLAGGGAELVIAGLSPSSLYTVYCYTEDFKAHSMDLNHTLATKVSASTLCCKEVLYSSFPRVIIDNRTTAADSGSSRTFQFYLDTVPSITTAFEVIVNNAYSHSASVPSRCSSYGLSTTAKSIPRTFSFSATSPSLTGAFVVKGNPGCYNVSVVSVTAGSAYVAATQLLRIRNSQQNPSAPTLLSAAFSPNGLSLVLTFDSFTDRGATTNPAYLSQFGCLAAVSFVGASTAVCSWSAADTLTASTLSQGLFLGSNVTLLPNKIKAAAVSSSSSTSSFDFASKAIVFIVAPSLALKPTASLNMARELSSCDDLHVDLTASIGSAGRMWQSITWSIITTPSNNVSDSALLQYLKNSTATLKSTSKLVVVPNKFISVYSGISVFVALTNFLGASSVASGSTSIVTGSFIPRLTISGPSFISQYTLQPVQLFAQAVFPACASQAVTKLLYTWTFMDGDGFVLFDAKYQGRQVDKRYFYLPSFTLTPLTSYIVQVSVFLSSAVTGDPPLTTAKSYINVKLGGVKSVLAGGNARSVSTQSPVVLDGSQSYDLDVQSAQSAVLTYRWQCIETSPAYGDSCPFIYPGDSSTDLFTISANTVVISVSTTYQVTLVVANDNGASDATTTAITYLTSAVPSPTIQKVLAKYNPSDKITLMASLDAHSSVANLQWSCDRLSTTSLTKNVRGSLALALQPSTLTDSIYLPISPNSLVAGLTYTFTLTAAFASSTASASASATIVINAPPSGGTFAVSPSTGTAMNSTFQMQAASWTDDVSDFPLQYIIATYSHSASSQTIVKNSGTSPSVSSQLGQGKAELAYVLTCIIYVSDIYSSTSTATHGVIVKPPASLNQVAAQTSQQLSDALTLGDANAVHALIGSATSYLNDVSCPNTTYCALLNRNPCLNVRSTCGSCLSGYLGRDGDSNVPCTSPSQKHNAKRKLSYAMAIDKKFIALASNQNISAIGEPCTLDDDCLSGNCSSGVCVDTLKTCPSNCTGNGTCVFFNSRNYQVNSCLQNDVYCKASCSCFTGAYGNDCSMDSATFMSKRALRDALCAALANTTDLQDVTSDVVESRASSVASILLDITQLSENGIRDCTNVLTDTIIENPDLAGQVSVAQMCSDALSLVLGNGPSLPSNITSTVVSALSVLSSGIAASLSAREDPVDVVTNNFRMSTSVVAASDLDASSFLIPTTATESYEDAVVPSLQVSASEFGSGGISVALMQLTVNTQNYSTDATPVSIGVSGNSADIQTIVTLVNKATVDYFNSSIDGNRSYYCDWSLNPYNVTYLCPDEQNVSVACSGFAGLVTFNCPTLYRSEPSCEALSSNGEFQASSKCQVVEYTAWETVCSCVNLVGDLSNSSTIRRKLGSSGGQALTDISSDSTLVVNSFTSNIRLANNLNAHLLTANKVILSVTASLTFLALVGVLWFVRIDLKESVQEDMAKRSKLTRFLPTKDFMNKVLPVEYSGKAWYKILFKSLLIDHSWLCLVLPYNPERDYRSVRWLLIVGKITNFLLVDTILAALFFADNGQCESFVTKSSCLQLRSLDQLDTLCVWDDLHRNCDFNHDIGNTALSTLILTTIITIITVPFDQFFMVIVRQVEHFFVDYYSRRGGLQIREVVVKEDIVTDLADLQTLQATMLRAASLMTMQNTIDNVAVETEAENLMHQVEDEQEDDILLHKVRATCDLYQFEGYLYDKRYEIFTQKQFKFNERSYDRLIRRLSQSREAAQCISDKLISLESDYDKNVLIIKEFLMASVSSTSRLFASKFFFPESASLPSNSRFFVQISCLLVLPAYIVLANFYIFLFGIGLGARSTNAWLRGACISLAIDMFLLTPFKSWVKRVMLAQFSYRDIKILHGLLRERTPTIMQRRIGQMSTGHSLVQHFNPACRAARMNPSLPASRLLMSLHDYDLPAHLLHDRNSLLWNYMQPIMLPLFVFAAVLTEVMPEVLSDSLLETASTSALNAGILGITLLALVSWGAVIAVLIIIVIILVWRERGAARKRMKVKSKAVLPIDDDDAKVQYINSADSAETLENVNVYDANFSTSNDLDKSVDSASRIKYGYRRKWFTAKYNGYVVPGKADWLTGLELIDFNKKTATLAAVASVDDEERLPVLYARTGIRVGVEETTSSTANEFAPAKDAINKLYTMQASQEVDVDETDFEYAGVTAEDNELNLLESWVARMQTGGSYLYNLDERLEHPMAHSSSSQPKFATPVPPRRSHTRNRRAGSSENSNGDMEIHSARVFDNIDKLVPSPMESRLEKGMNRINSGNASSRSNQSQHSYRPQQGHSLKDRSHSPMNYTSELASKYFKLRVAEASGEPAERMDSQKSSKYRTNARGGGRNTTDSPHASSVESMSLGESEHGEDNPRGERGGRSGKGVVRNAQDGGAHYIIGSIFADIEENVEL
jgi:hypothetical protein